jgi:hypothetical protein
MWNFAAAFGILAMAGGCAGQTSMRPLEPEQREQLDRISSYALGYARHLPDFICTRTARVSRSRSGAGESWQIVDLVEDELTSVAGQERYNLVRVNGRPVKPGTHPKVTFNSNGEFGATLIDLFADHTQAKFQWERAESNEGHSVSVFRFRVQKDNSNSKVYQGSKAAAVGYSGLLYANGSTGAVERLHIDSDDPEGLPIRGGSTDIRFAEAEIGGLTYWLPIRAELRIYWKKSLFKREMEYSSYHKYAADTALKYD